MAQYWSENQCLDTAPKSTALPQPNKNADKPVEKNNLQEFHCVIPPRVCVSVCVCIVVKPTLIKTALPFHDVSSSWDSHELCVTTDNGANILKATQTQQLGQTVVLGSLPATGQWEQTSQVGHCYTGLYWNSGTITTAILYKRNSSFSFTSRRPDGAFTGQCISKQNCFFTFALSHIISPSKKKNKFHFLFSSSSCLLLRKVTNCCSEGKT